MKLGASELEELLAVLEKIDSGTIRPRISGRIGRFLRQYARGRAELDEILLDHDIRRRKDAAVSGRDLGDIEAHPLLPPRASALNFPLGEVAETLCLSEELGAPTQLVMWLKGPNANAAYNLVREGNGVRFSGDFRWTPPGRLTPGEAHQRVSDGLLEWWAARCLKAVADDLARPPNALEYVLDYRLGPPGLKYFRCITAKKLGSDWKVLPAFSRPTGLEVEQTLPEPQTLFRIEDDCVAVLLIYREPWSSGWTIVDGRRIDAEEALAHCVTWADFQNELDGTDLFPGIVQIFRESFRSVGIQPVGVGKPHLSRSLLPVAREVLLHLRGMS